jgi:hypothetical protein
MADWSGIVVVSMRLRRVVQEERETARLLVRILVAVVP